MDISDLVRSHPDADLMVVHANYPRSQFDGDGDYVADQSWRLLTYNWTDIDGDGRLWLDKNGNGVVNHKQKGSSSNIDGNLDINFRASDMDEFEYVRFMYHRPGREHVAVLRPRPERAHGGRRLPRAAASGPRPGDRDHGLQDPGRLLRERRLAVDDDAEHGLRRLLGEHRRARRDAVRHVRRCHRARERRRPASSCRSRSPSLPTCRRTRRARSRATSASAAPTWPLPSRTCSTTTAPSSARTTGRGVRSRATGASSSWTSPRHRRRARCSLRTRCGTTRPRTRTSTP